MKIRERMVPLFYFSIIGVAPDAQIRVKEGRQVVK